MITSRPGGRGTRLQLSCRPRPRGVNALLCPFAVDFLYCDLASLRSVQLFVDAFKKKNLPLHVLVNNGESVAVAPGREGTRGRRVLVRPPFA